MVHPGRNVTSTDALCDVAATRGYTALCTGVTPSIDASPLSGWRIPFALDLSSVFLL